MEKVSKDPLISIVIPAYKVEKYLEKCIDSVINQTYTNLEIILVDDGSPDNCPKICDEYAKKDSRIKVIHKENGGLSDARNKGIEIASGEYISFIDSDDYISQNYVEMLYENIKKYDSDIAIGGHKVLYDDGKIINRYTNEEFCISPKEALNKILYDDGIDLSAWAKLYKKDLFENIKYPVGRLYEDSATTYKLIDLAKKVSVHSVPIYFYIMRSESITNNNFSEKKLDLITSTKEMTEYIQIKYPELKAGCDRRLIYAYLSTLTQLTKSKVKYPKIQNELILFIKKNQAKILMDKRVPKRDKLGILSLNLGFNFYKLSWNFYSIFRGENNA